MGYSDKKNPKISKFIGMSKIFEFRLVVYEGGFLPPTDTTQVV